MGESEIKEGRPFCSVIIFFYSFFTAPCPLFIIKGKASGKKPAGKSKTKKASRSAPSSSLFTLLLLHLACSDHRSLKPSDNQQRGLLPHKSGDISTRQRHPWRKKRLSPASTPRLARAMPVHIRVHSATRRAESPCQIFSASPPRVSQTIHLLSTNLRTLNTPVRCIFQRLFRQRIHGSQHFTPDTQF